MDGLIHDKRHPQPHEGIQGSGLPEGHLLALTEESIARRLEMLTCMWQRWDDILHGRIADRDALFERMYNPQVGDLVVEQTSSFRRNRDSQIQASGILLVHERKEWASSDEDWALTVSREEASHRSSGLPFDVEEFARERFADKFTYIQYGADPGNICRWSNCKFIAVPQDIAERFTQPRR